VPKKLNDSGAFLVGKIRWLEAFELMISGEDEDGADTALTEGPFRTREKALAFAKLKYKGFASQVLVTFVEERWTRFKGLPRKKMRKKKKSS